MIQQRKGIVPKFVYFISRLVGPMIPILHSDTQVKIRTSMLLYAIFALCFVGMLLVSCASLIH